MKNSPPFPHVLITGGAGFIGSHLADELIDHGYRVRVLDVLCEQVHGTNARRPAYLHPEVELIIADIRDRHSVRRALQDVDAVFHFAARVGVGQSMYQLHDYMDTNAVGTAVLLEALGEHRVERLVVASSMSVYGEGLYADARGGRREAPERSEAQLRSGQWDPRDEDGAPLTPLPTAEDKHPNLASVYALSKYDQERLCLLYGRTYGIPTVALRFFNVYGERQALSNPYTGVLAIFAARLLNDRPPLIFEDGGQQRDFVHVHDVARACRLALEVPHAAGGVFNIGSGQASSVREIARRLAETLGVDIAPQITGAYRRGDIRHCYADITRARAVLDYAPRVDLATGLAQLAKWLSGQSALDRVEEAGEELRRRGLAL
jgi:dTDP-L-rhamnose 4-epimerase